jgi:PAS domain S-box-containing protein
MEDPEIPQQPPTGLPEVPAAPAQNDAAPLKGEASLRTPEEQFRRAIEEAPIPMIMHAEDGEVLQISRSWTELTGYTLADMPTLDAWLDHAYGDGADAVRNHVHDLFAGSQPALNVTFDVRTHAGELRHWSFSASSPGTLRDGRRFVIGMALDITERTRAEQALAEQARLLDLSNDAIIVRDVANRILYWNRGATDLYGWTREEAVGQDLHTLLGTEFEAPFEQLIATLHDHDRMEGEVVQVARDGRRLTLLCRWALDRDAEGRPGAILTSYNDITERKRAEQLLRASEQRQSFLLKLSDALRELRDPIEVQATASRVLGEQLDADRAYYVEIDEARAEYVVARDWHRPGAPSHARRYPLEGWPMSWLAGGETWVVRDVDTDPAMPDNQREAYRGNDIGAAVVVPLIKGGRLVATLVANQAVPRAWTAEEIALVEETAQRTWAAVERARAEAALSESEERFRLLVEGAGDYAMFLLDDQNRITFWSKGAERVFGWSEGEALGQDGAIVFTAEDRARGIPAQERITAQWEGSALDRRWHVRKDGRLLFLDGALIRLDEEQGGLRGFVKIARDATAQREAEEALQRAHDELEQRVQERTAALAASNQARQELLRQLVRAQEEERLRIARDLHDQLGQQITALLLGFKQLEGAAQGTPLAAMLPPLQDLTQQLAKDAHHLAVNLRPTALDDVGLIPALERLVEDWGRQARITTAFHSQGIYRDRLPLVLETTLYRAVQEALTNVGKHAEARSVSVLLERRDDEVVAIVEDDGRGFDPDAAPARTERPPIGLRGMSERVAQVGGTLEIESSPGSGTTLFVRVPLSEEAEPF